MDQLADTSHLSDTASPAVEDAEEEEVASLTASSGQVERIARAVLAMWLARADLDIARPSREDVPVDELVTPRDLSWVAPLQIKGVGNDEGLLLHRKYVGRPLLLCYVFLGRDDGGLDSRPSTTVVVLTPEVAWQLPTALGRKHNPDNNTYRFPQITAALAARLEEHIVKSPGDLAMTLERLAPLRCSWVPNAASVT